VSVVELEPGAVAIEMRLSRQQRLVIAASGAVLAGLLGVAVTWGEGPVGWLIGFVVAAALTFPFEYWLLPRTSRLRIDPHGIRSGWRRIPWSRITGTGVRTTGHGRKLVVWAPFETALLMDHRWYPDPLFDDKAATIEAWWRRCAPPPDPPATGESGPGDER
jgi:hypothetical protein